MGTTILCPHKQHIHQRTRKSVFAYLEALYFALGLALRCAANQSYTPLNSVLLPPRPRKRQGFFLVWSGVAAVYCRGPPTPYPKPHTPYDTTSREYLMCEAKKAEKLQKHARQVRYLGKVKDKQPL
jgi:hypothetical protein